jgi:hypothetical protein
MTLLERCDEVSHPALSVCAQLVDENVHTERARTTIHALLLYLSLKPDHAMLRRKYGTVRVSKRFPTGPACPLATILSYALSTISCEPSVSKFDICNAPNPLTEGSRFNFLSNHFRQCGSRRPAARAAAVRAARGRRGMEVSRVIARIGYCCCCSLSGVYSNQRGAGKPAPIGRKADRDVNVLVGLSI